jgi:hypothetical protein
MARTTHERNTYTGEAGDTLEVIRTTLGAACIPLPDTRSSLSVLQVKKDLELKHGVDTTLTLHRVFPGEAAPRYTGQDQMVAVFTPTATDEIEATIRDKAVEELQADIYPQNVVGNWSEVYPPRTFRGPSESVLLPDDLPPAPDDQVRYIAHILTEQSAVVAA